MLEPTRWDEVKGVVLAALDLPEEERSAYLDEVCGDDENLRSAAAALLAVSTKDADAFDHARVAFTTPSPVHIPEDALIDDYRVIHHIGEGAMGAVYLTEDTKHDRQVALKVLSPRGMRFSRSEHKLLAHLSHPNIATLFDSGTTDNGFPYLVMEYVAGEPLPIYCEKHCPTIESRLQLFLSICDAVAYAHQHLIIHRDLKPGNILVTADGVPKVVDFGIAKRLPSDILATNTDSPHPPLTLAFASPEQLRNTAPATTSDIYSLGVILCTLLTARLPYRGRDFLELYSAVPSQEPEKPSILAIPSTGDEKLPPLWIGPQPPQSDTPRLTRLLRGDLDAITLKALRKEPEKRYQTVGEFADDIRRYLANEPVAARKGSRRYRAWKFWKRNKRDLLVAAGVLLVLIGLSINLLFQYHEATRQRDEAARHLERSEQTKNFLLDIFRASDPWRHPAENPTARELLDNARNSIADEFVDDPLLRADVLATLAQVYYRLGSLETAVKLQREVVELRQKALGPENAEVATALSDLGVFLNDLGKYEEAKVHLTSALALRKKLLGTYNGDVSTTHNNLGTLAFRMDDLALAEKHFRKALLIRKNLPGDFRHKDAATLSNLSVLLKNAGRLEEAEEAARQALNLQKELHPPTHPSVGLAIENLGQTLKEQGRLTEAERHLREALEIQRQSLGEHPSVARALSNLAVLLTEMERFAEAEQIHRQALAIDQAILPKDHPDFATRFHNLGTVLREQGRLREAEEFFRKALAIRKEAFGESHTRTASTQVGLAGVLLDLRQNVEAQVLMQNAYRVLSAELKEGHRLRSVADRTLGRCLVAQGRYAEAEPLLMSSYLSIQEDKGPSARDIHRSLSYLIELYESWGKPDQAAKYKRLLAENSDGPALTSAGARGRTPP